MDVPKSKWHCHTWCSFRSIGKAMGGLRQELGEYFGGWRRIGRVICFPTTSMMSIPKYSVAQVIAISRAKVVHIAREFAVGLLGPRLFRLDGAR